MPQSRGVIEKPCSPGKDQRGAVNQYAATTHYPETLKSRPTVREEGASAVTWTNQSDFRENSGEHNGQLSLVIILKALPE
jgi:hypothetical protein